MGNGCFCQKIFSNKYFVIFEPPVEIFLLLKYYIFDIRSDVGKWIVACAPVTTTANPTDTDEQLCRQLEDDGRRMSSLQ
jgi:hypothetical protein